MPCHAVFLPLIDHNSEESQKNKKYDGDHPAQEYQEDTFKSTESKCSNVQYIPGVQVQSSRLMCRRGVPMLMDVHDAFTATLSTTDAALLALVSYLCHMAGLVAPQKRGVRVAPLRPALRRTQQIPDLGDAVRRLQPCVLASPVSWLLEARRCFVTALRGAQCSVLRADCQVPSLANAR